MALNHALAAVQLGQRLVDLEPSNAEWSTQRANALLDQAQIMLRSGKVGEARGATDQGCGIANGLIARDPTVVAWRDTGITCLRLRAELAANSGARDEALALANQVLAGVRAIDSKSDPFALAQAQKLLGDVMMRSGDRPGAMAAWQAALAAWPKGVAETPSQKATRGELLRSIGDRAEGGRIAAELAAKGYRRSLSNRAGI
jgi:hypothetical protein